MVCAQETILLTFRDSEKSNGDNCIAMSTAHLIMDLAERHIERMELLVSSHDRHGGLVRAEDHRH